MNRKCSYRAKELVKKFEGLRRKTYYCQAGVATIGWGHTKDVKPETLISTRQAEMFLDDDIADVEAAIERHVNPDIYLTAGQLDSLVSWVFNLGERNLSTSTLLKRINANELDRVPKEIKKWVYASGKVSNGLVKRRNEEAALWMM